ncbi:hypothetical protein [Mycobacterium sp. 29Ha]|nr:hypothetical protein [Mycobacterium sp. 29Ha]MDV3131637.1 hypothetical protein [Mycobacterium sp. 29Ha]
MPIDSAGGDGFDSLEYCSAGIPKYRVLGGILASAGGTLIGNAMMMSL